LIILFNLPELVGKLKGDPPTLKQNYSKIEKFRGRVSKLPQNRWVLLGFWLFHNAMKSLAMTKGGGREFRFLKLKRGGSACVVRALL